MKLSMRRIVLFTSDMPGVVEFYRDMLGRRLSKRPPKIGFWSDDLAAMREALIGRGAKLGNVMTGGGLTRCEGKNPDGNPYSISDRP